MAEGVRLQERRAAAQEPRCAEAEAEQGRSGGVMAEKGRGAARKVLELQERLRSAQQPVEVPGQETKRGSCWAVICVFIRAFL